MTALIYIYKSNIIERYSLQPKAIPAVDKLCLAEFAVFYYKDYRTEYAEISDSQPDVLNDDLLESHNLTEDTEQCLPPKIKLINKNEYMKYRKVKVVLRYHAPNKTKQPELYFPHLLMLYFPWRNEEDLLSSDQTYTSKFYEPNVQSIVEQNSSLFETDADAITEALEAIRNNEENTRSYDFINDQENSDLRDETPNVSDPNESFTEQQPSDLGSTSSNQHSSGTITNHPKFLMMSYSSQLDP